MAMLPSRGLVMLPKRGADEAAPEIDVPFEITSDDGDRISATVTRTGSVKLQAVDRSKVADLGTVEIEGFQPGEAQAIARSVWGRIWSALKAAVRAVINAITFDGGPYLGTCRGDVQVTHVDGIPVGATVGVSCTQ